jgi:hypothetical protein
MALEGVSDGELRKTGAEGEQKGTNRSNAQP